MGRTRANRTVTLQDIARRAGCSANTVSLALRDSSRISDHMRQRIRKLARNLNYMPNYAARNLRRRRSGLIGIYLTQALQDAVRTEMVNRLLEELHTAEYRPVLGIGEGGSGEWDRSPWMDTFRQLRVEALVIIAMMVDDLPTWSQALPVILLGCHPNESLRCDYLALDRTEAARLAVEHLLSRGHRHVLVGCSLEHPFGQGCVTAIRSAGAKALVMKDARWHERDEVRRLAGAIARAPDGPTAAVLGDAADAGHFIAGLLDAGRQVPADVAVVAYDYFPWADLLRVPLTTVEQPIREMAPAAVELIQKRLAHPHAGPIHLVKPHRLVARKSS